MTSHNLLNGGRLPKDSTA